MAVYNPDYKHFKDNQSRLLDGHDQNDLHIPSRMRVSMKMASMVAYREKVAAISLVSEKASTESTSFRPYI